MFPARAAVTATFSSSASALRRLFAQVRRDSGMAFVVGFAIANRSREAAFEHHLAKPAKADEIAKILGEQIARRPAK